MKKLIALCTVLALMLGLCGCTVNKAEDALTQYLDAVGDLQYVAANELAIIDAADEDKIDPVLTQSDFNDTLLASLTYDIWSSEKVDSDTVTFRVQLHQIAMKQVYSDVITQYSEYMLEQSTQGIDPTEEEITQVLNQYMLEAVQDNKTVKTTSTVEIEMRKVDGKWKVVMDKELLNGLFGGLVEAMDELISTDDGE